MFIFRLEDRARFEVELEDLAGKYGLKLKPTPFFSYGGPLDPAITPGPPLCPVYDRRGNLIDEWCVIFTPKS